MWHSFQEFEDFEVYDKLQKNLTQSEYTPYETSNNSKRTYDKFYVLAYKSEENNQLKM